MEIHIKDAVFWGFYSQKQGFSSDRLIQLKQAWWVTQYFSSCFLFTEIFVEASYCWIRAQHRDVI